MQAQHHHVLEVTSHTELYRSTPHRFVLEYNSHHQMHRGLEATLDVIGVGNRLDGRGNHLLQDHKETMDSQDRSDHQDHSDLQDQDHTDLQDQDHTDLQDQDLTDLLAHMDHQDREDLKDHGDHTMVEVVAVEEAQSHLAVDGSRRQGGCRGMESPSGNGSGNVTVGKGSRECR